MLIAVPIGRSEANAFVLSHHRHSKPITGFRFAIGASDGQQLVGVVTVGRPVARMLDDGSTAEVTRCCVTPAAPRGCCSFLYSRAWRAWSAMGGGKLITYTLDTESGASLRGAGWRVINQQPVRTGNGWLNRPGREWQSVYGQGRLCWEVGAA